MIMMKSNKRNQFILLFVLSIALQIKFVQAGSIPFLSYTSKFISGNHIFVPSFPNNTSVSQRVTVQYGARTVNNYNVLLGIVDLNMNINVPSISFSVLLNAYSNTYFIYNLTYDNGDSLTYYRISWLTVDDIYRTALCISNTYHSGTPGLGPSRLTYTLRQSNRCGMVYNLSHTIKGIPFIRLINMSSTNFQYQAYTSISIYNSTYTSYTFSIRNNNTNVYIFDINFLILDQTYVIQLTPYKIQVVSLLGVSNASVASPTTLDQFYSNNSFIGLTGFQTLPGLRYQFTTIISNRTTVSLPLGYAGIQLTQIIFSTKNCSNPSYPYFKSIDLRCYDDCGDFQFNNPAQLICSNCSSNCFDCSNSSSCNICINGYFINGTNFTNNCVSDCGLKAFENLTSLRCQQCHSSCQDCTNSINCSSCSSGFNLDNGKCMRICSDSNCSMCNSSAAVCQTCKSGFNLNNGTCIPCIDPNCSQCNSSISICQICKTSFSPLNGTCVACQDSNCSQCNATFLVCQICKLGFNVKNGSCFRICNDSNCAQCNTSALICQICQNSFILNNNSLCISSCSMTHCFKCTTDQCLQCSLGYSLSNNICSPVCGDGMILSEQQCDDGNIFNWDGCSSDCKLETGFSCQISVITNRTQCNFTSSINGTLLSFKKSPYQNTVVLQFLLYPPLKAFESMNFKDMIFADIPITNSRYIYNPETGIITVNLDYNQTLQGKQATFTFDPPNIGIFAQTPTSFLKIMMVSENNLGIYSYSNSDYNLSIISSQFSLVVVSLALSMFLLGMFTSLKMLVIQMMSVFQLSFLALVMINNLHPGCVGLLSFFLSNGYNNLFQTKALEDSNIPNKIKGIYMFGQFAKNYNLILFLFLLPLFFGLIFFILGKTVLKEKEKSMELYTNKCIGEYAFTGLMFGAYLASFSFALQFVYGVKNTNSIIGYWSIVECTFMLISFSFYFVLILLRPEWFGQYVQQFNKQFCMSAKYYNCLMIERLIIGNLFVLMINFKFGIVVPFVLCLIQLIYVFVKWPYVKKKHNLRVIANMSICMIIMGAYPYYSLNTSEYINISWLSSYLPFLVIMLLLFCLIYHSIFVIESVIQNIRKLFCQRDTLRVYDDSEYLNIKVKQNSTLKDVNINNHATSYNQILQTIVNFNECSDEKEGEQIKKEQIKKEQIFQQQLSIKLSQEVNSVELISELQIPLEIVATYNGNNQQFVFIDDQSNPISNIQKNIKRNDEIIKKRRSKFKTTYLQQHLQEIDLIFTERKQADDKLQFDEDDAKLEDNSRNMDQLEKKDGQVKDIFEE